MVATIDAEVDSLSLESAQVKPGVSWFVITPGARMLKVTSAGEIGFWPRL